MRIASASSVEGDHHLHRDRRSPPAPGDDRPWHVVDQGRADVVAALGRVGDDAALGRDGEAVRRGRGRDSPRRSPSAVPRSPGPDRDRASAGPAVQGAVALGHALQQRARWTGRSTRMREAAEQVWPAFWMPALTRKGSAASRSASAKTICGRSCRRARASPAWRGCAAAACTSAPVATEPVKEMWSMPPMGGERRAGFLAEAGDDIERAGREAGLARRCARRPAR